MSRVLVVSNRLPVTLHPERPAPQDVQESSGGLASALRSVVGDYEELVWIGWPGTCVADAAEQQRMTCRMKEASSTIKLVPVWLSQADIEDFYTGYSNSSLWPLLHWMTPYARFKRSWSEAYKRVNEQYADVIASVATPEDLIWIHDYHLFLVPNLLRKKRDNEVMQSELKKAGLIEHPVGLGPNAPSSQQDGYSKEDQPLSTKDLEERLAAMSSNERMASGIARPLRRSVTEVELRSKLKIAFFLHTPFPAYEVLCALPQCVDIVEGILGADLVGFHTYNYLRHFRSCVIRLCGFTPEIDHVDHKGQRTKLGVYPIGANVQGIQEAMKTEKFAAHLKEYTDQFAGKSLVLNVERLDYSKGLPQKLAAIERYLEDATAENPDTEDIKHSLEALQKRFDRLDKRKANRGLATSNLKRIGAAVASMLKGEKTNASETLDHKKTVFVFIAVPSRQDVEEYQNIEEEVHRSISTINGRFSTLSHQPIVYIHRGVPLAELAALYARADCCLVTPLIDGMNLVAKEFIAAKDPAIENVVPGTVILSELAGAAQELFDAIVVNPYDEDAVADAICVGLELTRRHLNHDLRWEVTERMRQSVIENDAVAWAKAMLTELDEPSKGSRVARPERLQMQLLPDTAASSFFESNPGTKGFFLDYDGTLREFEKRPEDAVPTEDTLKLFERLSERKDLKMFIVSGRNKEFLEEHFGSFASLTLIAEHGYFKRGPDTGLKWVPFTPYTALDWMEKIKPVMEIFKRCTPGAVIEEKASAIVWHYRDCDEEYGQFKAKELMHQLAQSLNNLPCQISQGQKIVEVSSLTVKKGIVVASAIQQQENLCGRFSELLICGDDRTDESMFLDAPPGAWTVKVGPGDTAARHRLRAPADVRRFLGLIAEQKMTPTPRAAATGHARFFSAVEEPSAGRLSRASSEGEGEDPLDSLPETETEQRAAS